MFKYLSNSPLIQERPLRDIEFLTILTGGTASYV
jgi:hypothetical protein